jgi:hypothetical protein
MDDTKYPPVTQIAMVSLALIIAGGIYLSANLPEHVSLAPAVILLVLSAGLMAFNLFSLTRVKDFAWDQFLMVARWSLLAYIVIGGMIEFVFVHNHVRGGTLVVLSLSLLIFSIHVPALMGFTVARYHQAPDPGRAA